MESIYGRFKSIVVLNSQISVSQSLSILLKRKLPIIATDGAAWLLKDLDIVPKIIIGDLDSLRLRDNSTESFLSSEVIQDGSQEINDFEKALRLVDKRKLSPTLIIGMQGGDLEHSFNNWSVLMKLSQHMELWLLDNQRVGVVLTEKTKLNVRNIDDKLVSLIPQNIANLSTEGLRWELKNETLALGVREGARNQIIQESFSVEVDSGSLLVFIGANSDIELSKAQ